MRSSSEYFIYQGLLLEQNCDHTVTFTFSLIEDAPFFEYKQTLIPSKTVQVFDITNRLEKSQFETMIAFVRFITFDDDPNIL